MSTATITRTDSGLGDQQPTPSVVRMPPNFNPGQYLHWRLLLGRHLAQTATQPRICHRDSWVQDLANYAVACRDRGDAHQADPVYLAIKEAMKIAQTETLERHILEARLLAQETPPQIASRCRFSALTIDAYAKLLFDVQGVRRKGIWMLRPPMAKQPPSRAIGEIGHMLKMFAAYHDSQAFEEYLGILLHLDGPSLADGLPARNTLQFIKEFEFRSSVAEVLRPRRKARRRQKELCPDAEELCPTDPDDAAANSPPEVTLETLIGNLAKAKIPVTLQKTMRRLREHSLAAQRASTPA